ncbi:MAG: hypothetical protein QHH15_06800 [Candidatus Thermoplasmatota archaeon]|nr:hypothetical protein [Candidatus Thermoplasmatota archaeon]
MKISKNKKRMILVRIKRDLRNLEEWKKRYGTNYVVEAKISRLRSMRDKIYSADVKMKKEDLKVSVDVEGQRERQEKRLKQLKRKGKKSHLTLFERYLMEHLIRELRGKNHEENTFNTK